MKVKPCRVSRSSGCKERSESLSSQIILFFISGPMLIDTQRLSITHWLLQGLRTSSGRVRFFITWPWRAWPSNPDVNLTCRLHVPVNRSNNSKKQHQKLRRTSNMTELRKFFLVHSQAHSYSFPFFRYFLLVFWLGICVEVNVDIITIPRPVPMFFYLPATLSLIQVAVIWYQSAPKDGFVAV